MRWNQAANQKSQRISKRDRDGNSARQRILRKHVHQIGRSRSSGEALDDRNPADASAVVALVTWPLGSGAEPRAN